MDLSQDMLDSVAVALIAVDPRGTVVFSNPAATRLFGYSSNQFAALHIADLLPVLGEDPYKDQPLPTDAPAIFKEIFGVHKSGESLSLEAQIAPWRTDSKELNYTLVFRDISAEREFERARYANDRRMAHAVRGSRIGIFEVDLLNQTSQVSNVWRELMEIQPEEEVEPQAEWLKRIHPDDLPLVQKADKDCIKGQSNRSLADYRMRSRNGLEWRWMRSDSVVSERDENGMATRLVGAQTDITKSKNAEQALLSSERQLRSAMENALISNALVAPDGRWLFVNSALCKFLGYSKQELLATDYQSITHPDDLEKDNEYVNELLSGKTDIRSFRKRYIRNDGEIVWGDLNVVLVKDNDGAPLHFIAQIVDVTEQDRLDRLKRNFVSTVSHELRTPVTAIAAALDLIALDTSHAFSGKLRKLMSIARENAGRLRLLLDDILDFDRLSSEKMPINPVRADVTKIVGYSIRSIQPYADQYNVDVTLESPEQPQFCKVDPARLEQILTNVLSNAAKFSHDGGLVTVRVQPDGDHVHIAVADQGIGIPAEFHETIFKPFSQVAPSDTRNRMGTGLGLSISKQLIERMGGTIGLNSNLGKGSEFWIKLPVGS